MTPRVRAHHEGTRPLPYRDRADSLGRSLGGRWRGSPHGSGVHDPWWPPDERQAGVRALWRRADPRQRHHHGRSGPHGPRNGGHRPTACRAPRRDGVGPATQGKGTTRARVIIDSSEVDVAAGCMSSSTFEELRARHVVDRDAALPRYVGQLQWSADQLRTERERRMRVLLATAKTRSAWHRERLRHIDAATFTERDLRSLPTMSKDDLMNNFEAVVTVAAHARRRRRHVERPPENLYLFDRYLVLASGGSSGCRGVFVYDWEGFVAFYCQVNRWSVRNGLPPVGPWANLVAPRGAAHHVDRVRRLPTSGRRDEHSPDAAARGDGRPPQRTPAEAAVGLCLDAQAAGGREPLRPPRDRSTGGLHLR